MKRIRSFVVSLVFVAVLALQLCMVPARSYTRYCEGIEYAEAVTYNPRLMRIFAIRVSLRNPDVYLFATPGNGGLPYEVTRQTTIDFMNIYGLYAAANASFFNAGLSPNTDVYGLLVSNFDHISWPHPSPFNSQLVFAQDKTAHLVVDDNVMGGIHTGVGGAEMVLENGVVTGGLTDVQPRTAMGLSQDRKYLIMIVIDGRRPGWSLGATYYDVGEWLRIYGAWDGVIMDGGGSSCIARAGVGVMNRPSDGSPRAVASNLGIGSQPSGTTGPSACSMNPGRVDMAIRGNLNQVYWKTWTAANGWGPLIPMGTWTYDTPAIVSRADGILDMFTRSVDNQMYHNHYENGSWSGWVSLGGVLLSGPYAASMHSNNMEIVYRGGDNAIWYLSWNSGVWSYGSLGGITFDRPAVASMTPTTKNTFHRGMDNCLWYNYYDGNNWSAWVSLGGYLTSGPAAISRNSNNLEIVYRSSYDNLWFLSWNSGVWNYGNLGGAISGVPAICSVDPTSATVYVRGTDDGQYLKAYIQNYGWTDYSYQGAFY